MYTVKHTAFFTALLLLTGATAQAGTVSFTVSGIEPNGDTATAMAAFKPGAGSLIAAAPMASVHRGRYTLNSLQNEWKLIAFDDAGAGQAKAVDSKPAAQTPASSDGPRTVLDAYFRQLKGYYPPGRGVLSENAAIDDETRKFWKLDTLDARQALGNSNASWEYYRPSAWRIENLSGSGQTATIRVAFTIGNKDVLRSHKGNPTTKLIYTLVRERENWFLTGVDRVKVRTGSEGNTFTEGAITYMNKLKSCTPHTFSYSLAGKNIIKGMQREKCMVDYVMPNNMLMRCAYSAETIALLTSEQKYREVRTGRMSGSSSSPESKAMARECTTTSTRSLSDL